MIEGIYFMVMIHPKCIEWKSIFSIKIQIKKELQTLVYYIVPKRINLSDIEEANFAHNHTSKTLILVLA